VGNVSWISHGIFSYFVRSDPRPKAIRRSTRSGLKWDEVAREAREAENGTPAHDFVTLKRRG